MTWERSVLGACLLVPALLRAQSVPLLGEGVPQPGNRPLPIPHAVARHQPSTVPWSVRFARAVMTRNPQTHRRWDYTAGVVLGAIEQVGRAQHDTAMLRYVQRNVDRFISPAGELLGGYSSEDYTLDAIAEGRVLLALAERTRDQHYVQGARQLRAQLRTHPRTIEGGLWHKRIYPHQMWLDGLYMAQPFAAQYAATRVGPVERDSLFADITHQFLLVARHMRDPRTQLLYHGWDATHTQPWADSATGLSRVFWGRAVGWYAMALVETLEWLPASHPDRVLLVQALQEVAEGIARVQDPVTGLWWDILDAPNREGNYLEASASAMFVYAFARGARRGYLSPRFRTRALRGFDGITTNLVRSAAYGPSLINVCQVSGLGGAVRADGSQRDGSIAYYLSEPVVSDDYKGLGPLILAALELGQ